MIRSEHLIESTDKVLALTPVEASALQTVGKRLVSKKSWWGGTEEEEDVWTAASSVSSLAEAVFGRFASRMRLGSCRLELFSW